MNGTVILVTRAGLGTTTPDDAPFALDMLDKFFHTLEKPATRPRAICFYTEGVRLVARGSIAELGLRLLESQGVELVACQSCVERYGLQDQVAVGKVGTMADIVRLMSEADKVITV